MSDPLLDNHVRFDPSQPAETLLGSVPAKWVVYLLADAKYRPVQLLCVRNLRRSLQARLFDNPLPVPTRRANLSQVVRNIHFRRVDSDFEADWVYLRAAERFFPDLLDRMPGFQPAWFITVDPGAQFPRFARVDDPSAETGVVLGPVESRQAVQSLIEKLEDWFDLCRYHHILTESPNGKACAYKEMGKCPAPCDGTIPMDEYRSMIRRALAFLVDPAAELSSVRARMDAAAGQLEFERASNLKSRMEDMSRLRGSIGRHLRRIQEFSYISIQPGPKKGTARVFLATRAGVRELAHAIDTPSCTPEMLNTLRAALVEASDQPGRGMSIREVGLVAHHLFSPPRSRGSFIHVSELTQTRVEQALKDRSRGKTTPDPVDDTGSRELGLS